MEAPSSEKQALEVVFSTLHYNTLQHNPTLNRNCAVAEGGSLASSLDVDKFSTSYLKSPLKKGEGIPKQECLVLRSTTISSKQLKKAQ